MERVDIKLFRKQNNISQVELASYLETSRPFISMVEQGKSKLPYDKYLRLMNNDKGWDVSMFHSHSVNVGDNSSGVVVNGDNVHSPIDNRHYYSDSPDVLRAQIDLLDERIKEKDAQIKEKDAQIKEKDAQIKEKDAQIKEKDAQIKQLLDILAKR